MDELIRFECAHCGQRNKVPRSAAGKVSLCPHCNGASRVPIVDDGLIRFACAGCRATIKVPESAVGKRAACPQCGQKNLIPARDLAGSSFEVMAGGSARDQIEQQSDPELAAAMRQFEDAQSEDQPEEPADAGPEPAEEFEPLSGASAAAEAPSDRAADEAGASDTTADAEPETAGDIIAAAIGDFMEQSQDDPSQPESVIIGDSQMDASEIAFGKPLAEPTDQVNDNSDESWASVIEYVNRIDQPMDGSAGFVPSSRPGDSSVIDSGASMGAAMAASGVSRSDPRKQEQRRAKFDASRLFESEEMMPTQREPAPPPAKAGGIGPLIAVSIIAVLLLGFGVWQAWSLIGDDEPAEYAFYDTGENVVFVAGSDRVPPFQAGSGHEAVRAHLFSCGSCDEPADRFVGYLEKYTDHARDALIEYRRRAQRGYTAEQVDQLRTIIDEGLLVADPEQRIWVRHDSPQGQRIRGSVTCPDGGDAEPCD